MFFCKRKKSIFHAADVFLSILCILFFLMLNSAYATPDKEITYHGKLTDNLGLSVPDGNYDFTISIFNAPVGGTRLWTARGTTGSPMPKIVDVTNGVFSTVLGESGDNSITLSFDENYYLEITIGSNAPMSPRRKVTPTGFALNAHRLNGLTADHFIDTSATAQTKQGDLSLNGAFSVGVGAPFHVSSSGDVTSGNWEGSRISAQYGGTGIDTSSATGVATLSSGTWSVNSYLGVSIGGTGTSTQFTQGSILFAGASGVYSQDNANFFWDNVNKRLGIGTVTPLYDLDVRGTGSYQSLITQGIRIGGNSSSMISSYGGYSGYTNFSGGIGTGGMGDSVHAQRITSEGNLVNIGSIQAGEMNLSRGGTFATKVDYTAGSGTGGVVTGDFNGDEKVDMAVSNYSASTISIFLNNGNGTFATKVDYGVNANPSAVDAGDLNGDGYTDLVVMNSTVGNLSVLLNNGNGTFATKVDYAAYNYSSHVSIGDLDGDGNNDISLLAGGVVSVFLNNGNGTFATKVDYSTGGAGGNTGLAIGDLNGDGAIDFAVSRFESWTYNYFTLMFNNGDGTFGTPVQRLMGTYTGPSDLAIGDVNGDSKNDVVQIIDGYGNGRAYVYMNNGGGSFAASVAYVIGNGPSDVMLVDLNGDGKRDMAATHTSSSGVSVLLNNGGGTFATKVEYAALGNPSNIVASDLNGDGKNDLAVSDGTASSVSVLLNQTQSMLYAQASTGRIGIGDTTPDHLLDVAGNIGLDAGSYINFGDTDGTIGYGIRDNTGVLEFKNASGSWTALGSGGMTIGGAVTSATEGSIFFAGSGGILAQDNVNFFWDNTNKRLGIGTNASTANLAVKGTTTEASLGAEQVTNGNFDTDATGWTATTWTWGSNRMNYTGTSGAITSSGGIMLNSGGTGYTNGDVLTLTNGANNATITVTNVLGGSITGFTLTSVGTACTVNASVSTTGGTGTGAQFSIVRLADSTNTLSQNVSITIGNSYQVTYTVARSAGEVNVTLGGVTGHRVLAGGTYTQIFRATTSGDLIFTPTINFMGSIDAISVKRVMSSTSVASLLNSDGTIGVEMRAGGMGSYNTFIGNNAGISNTSGGIYNVALGYSALQSNTVGGGNTAVGFQSLSLNTTGYRNTAVGSESLNFNTSGYQNSASGYQALRFNTTGSYNTASGSYSLVDNTTGSYNTAFGAQVLRSNTTGYNNTASGYNTLFTNTMGDNNSAFGVSALFYNTTGRANTASGSAALFYNTTGSYNTSSGYYSLYANITGNDNTATGAYSLRSNTTGNNNTAFGSNSLYANTTGIINTAAGYYALFSNTTGQQNSALGASSLYYNTSGSWNTAVGALALWRNTIGASNTALGLSALSGNTIGSNNLAAGNNALNVNTAGSQNSAMGAQSLYGNTTGSYNTSMGYYSLYANTTASYNVAVGSMSFFNLRPTSAAISAFTDAGSGNVTVSSANSLINGDSITISGTTNYNGTYTVANRTVNTFTIVHAFVSTETGWWQKTGEGQNNTALGHYTGGGLVTGSGNTILGSQVSGLAANLTNNIILANGTGAIKAQHDGTNWNFTGSVGIGTVTPRGALDVNGAVRLKAGAPNSTDMSTNGISFENNGDTGMFLTNYTGASGSGDLVFYNNNNPTIYMPAASTYVGIGIATPSQMLTVYNGSTTGTYTTSGWAHSSDERLKTNITSVSDPLQKVLALESVYFNWKKNPNEDRQIGLIAQDVKKVIPEVVVGNEKDGYGIAYGNLTSLLIGATQEQQKLIQTNTNDLSMKASAVTVGQLQSMTEDQFEKVSSVLRSTTYDDQTIRDDVFVLQSDINQISDDMEEIQMRIAQTEEMHTVLTEFFQKIDGDRLVFVDKEGDLTIDGVVVADSVKTKKLVITGEEKGAMIGTAAIAEDAYDVFVPTTAVVQESRIFVTPKRDVVTQTISVTRIDDHSGFHVTVPHPVDKPLEFDWLIVEDHITKEDDEMPENDVSENEESNEIVVEEIGNTQEL